MMDKTPIRSLFFISVIAVLSVAVVFLAVQNQGLSKTNRELLASRDLLHRKADRLEAQKNRLFRAIAKSGPLMKDVEGQKKSLEETIVSVKKQDEAIQFEMKKAEAQMNSALEEKTYLEDMLIHKTREITALKGDNPSAAQNAASTDAAAQSADITAKIREKEAEIQKLTEQNHALSEKMDRLYQVTTSKISEINVAKIALEETVSGAKSQIDEEWNTVNLGSISVDKKEKARSLRPQKKSGPKTTGKVLAVNEDHGFVVVDLGKVDNLSRAADLEIVRNGKSIASLSVLEIRDVMTACNIKNLESGQKIQINDVVRIQK